MVFMNEQTFEVAGADRRWQLLALLADGRAHPVRQLAKILQVKPYQLNAAWQQMPPHVRGLLRQQDGRWRLVRPLAVLSADDVQNLAADTGFQAALLPQTTSTNTVLLDMARAGLPEIHRAVRVALEQSEGRGRQGRTWHSRLGECLMLSVAWTFEQQQAQLGGLALVVALCVCEALRNGGVYAQIKWPNDIVLGKDKLGGILIETVQRNGATTAVIGIGLNFVVPKEVENATSVQIAVPQLQVRQIYRDLLAALARKLPEFAEQGLAPFLPDYCRLHRDQDHEVCLLREGKILAEGTVLGIAANGALVLHTEAGQTEFVSGEISLRPKADVPPPPQRCLLLDAGNSKLKWAWVENGELKFHGKAAYHELYLLQAAWQEYGSSSDRVVGSAVCGEMKQQSVAQALGRPVQWLGSMPYALGIRNHYRNIAEHGADRWFNVLGSRSFSQTACVVVSCGTAVTVDALTHNGQYLGGSILPGFHLMRESMAQRTANLNRPIGRYYDFATTTNNALASGMMDAVCGAIVLMHTRLQERVGAEHAVDILITGGGATKIARSLPQRFTLDKRIEIVDNLVLHGLLNWILQE